MPKDPSQLFINTSNDPGLIYPSAENANYTLQYATDTQVSNTIVNIIQYNLNTVGANNQVLINKNNVATGDAELTYDANTNILTSETISVANLNVSAIANLGLPSHVKITGGSNGYVLKTDGTGNLSWTSQQLASTTWTSLTGKPTFATVATSGDYNDLSNKPAGGATTTYVDNKIANVTYANLSGKPTLATVATSGAYNDLTNLPSLSAVALSGNYNDLANKPSIPSIAGLASTTYVDNKIANVTYANISGTPTLPTHTSNLINNSGYITNSALSGYATTSSLSSYALTTSLPKDITDLTDTTHLLFNGNYANLSGAPNIANYATNSNVSNLSNTVANITWANLSGKPALFSGSYNDLTSKPALFSGNYVDLTNKPALFSGNYNDLTSKPTLFSGAYSNLTGTPTIPTDIANLADATNLLFDGAYSSLTGAPALFSGSYTDLTSKPTIPDAQIQSDWTQTNNTLKDFIKNKPALFSGSYTDLSNKPALFSGSYNDLTSKPSLFSGSYVDLTNKPTLGNISSINKDGNASNVLYGNGVFAAASVTPSTTLDNASAGDMDVMTYDGSIKYTSNVTIDVSTGTLKAKLFSGNGSSLTSIAGANVTGTVANATYATSAGSANAVAWANVSGTPTIPTNLDSLSDVTITSATSGQVLKYNGTAWVNGTDASGSSYDQDLNTTDNVTFNTVNTQVVYASVGAALELYSGDGTPIPSGIVFNGAVSGGGYMVVPSSSDWALGTVWTIEFRIKITGDSTGKIYRVIDQDPTGAGGTSIVVSISSGQLTIAGTDQNPSYYPQPTINVWTHIAIVNNNATTFVDVYYDGVLQTNHTGYGGPSNYQNTNALYIGKIGGSGDFQYLAGVLSGIRISKVARYTQNFTLPTEVLASDSDTLLLMNVLSGAEYDDSSSYARIISHTNTTIGSIPGIGSNPGNVVVTANAHSWTFNVDGNLTAPGNIRMSNIGGIYSSSAGYTVGLKMSNTEPSVKLVAHNHEWQFNSNGVLKFPTAYSSEPTITMAESANLLIQGYKASGMSENGGNVIVSGGSAGDSGNNGNATVFGQQVAIKTQLSTDLGSTIYNWTFDADGGLSLPGGAVLTSASDKLVVNDNFSIGAYSSETRLQPSHADANVEIATLATGSMDPSIWKFGTNGSLTIPGGGVITETSIPGGGLTGNTIALKPSGGTNSNQQLLVYPTGNPDYNHLHLTSGNLYSTELFLGNDNYYVKLANTGNIIINSNDDVGNTAQWVFDQTGNLTLPEDGNILDSNNKPVIKIELPFDIKSTDFNAVAGGRYGVDTTSVAITATLPASPATGDAVFFADAGGAYSTNNLIVARNGHTIMGSASNMTVNVNDQSFGLFYNGTTWRVY
jgi:hypothetical protein